ncbi:MAG: DUF1080 domain-containing protein [Thermoguttaceae bacterium]|nr:DUF1080 domain-containing protein [Thermoguttaceae bacterium]
MSEPAMVSIRDQRAPRFVPISTNRPCGGINGSTALAGAIGLLLSMVFQSGWVGAEAWDLWQAYFVVTSQTPSQAVPSPGPASGQTDTSKPGGSSKQETSSEVSPTSSEAKYQWQSLFDGKELGKWAITRFGGEGEVTVKDGCIVLGMGNPMTGITWTGEVIRDNYELEIEAKRTSGIDFFATTTFPVGNEFCSFVVGGWAGTVVGLSCVDLRDASENETTQFKVFQDNRWYRIRIRVSEPKIECWIDDEKLVDIKRQGHKFTVRVECDLCRPLGIATWCTEGVIRQIRIRQLTPQEVIDIAEGLR